MTNGLDRNTAPLAVVSAARAALLTVQDRDHYLPGMSVLYGPSGAGKSTACAYLRNKYHAYYVECKSTWSKKALLESICKTMRIVPDRIISRMLDQICDQLIKSGRPMIIDEMDHLVERSAVEIIRDIYEGSKAAILLVGEERLPAKLTKWERFHGRILEWTAAPMADLEDAQRLSEFYCQGVQIQADLLEAIHRGSNGSVRRITINLSRAKTEAINLGLDTIGLKQWGKKELYTGDAPAPRRS